MLKRLILTIPLFGAFLLSSAAMNAATSYSVAVNTTALNGTTGSIDFMFNPGVGIFQSATAQVYDFGGGTYAGSQQVFGSVTGGPAPAAISLTNAAGDNEVLDTFKFGNALDFTVTFSGPAITSPNGSDTAASLFAFSIFSDAAGTIPALGSNANGVALEINASTQGALSSTIISPSVSATATPEPSTLALLGAPLALLAAMVIRRRSARA